MNLLEAAESLELNQLLDRLPKQFSGGQRQREAIDHAILKELLDSHH